MYPAPPVTSTDGAGVVAAIADEANHRSGAVHRPDDRLSLRFTTVGHVQLIPLWPIRTVCFCGPTVVADASRYARAHPDRRVIVAGASFHIGVPFNVEVCSAEDGIGVADLVVSASKDAVELARRDGRVAVVLGGSEAGAVAIEDLIDDVIPVSDQEAPVHPSSKDTNSLPSRFQSNCARAAS